MNTSNVKKLVRQYRKEFNIHDITVASLEAAFQKQGFTIIDFNPVLNDPDVDTVLKTLKLQDSIAHSNGFIYVDNNYRLVFLNEKMNEEERCVVLAHEEGHYYCGHMISGNIVGKDVMDELEANEFAHYLLHGTLGSHILHTVSKYRKVLIIGTLIAGIAIGGSMVFRKIRDQQLYEGEYYVTTHGTKYHLKNCVTIQGHSTKRLTKEDVENGTYEPCSVCQPDQ